MYRALREILSSSAAPRTLAVCTAHYYSGQLWCQWVWRGNGWIAAPWMSSRLEPHVDRDATPQYTRLFVARSALHSFGLSQLLRMCRPRRAPLGNWNSRFKAVEIVLVYSYAWLFASEHSPTRTRIRYIKYGYRTCDYVRTFQNETWAAYRAYAWAMVSTTTSTSGPIPAIQHMMITSVVPCTASPSFTKIRPHNVFAVRR